MRHYNITVKGKVQGVSYRFATLNAALKLHLTGYVKNMHNGDVYIEAEGNEENINRLISWCYVGSPKAEVTEVFAEEADLKEYRNFELKK